MNKGMVDTQLCRKIYSNYTHVVARCFFSASSSNGYQDYEMQKEMSAAPDWMVAHENYVLEACVLRGMIASASLGARDHPTKRTETVWKIIL